MNSTENPRLSQHTRLLNKTSHNSNKKIIRDLNYITNGELLIVVKDVESCNIILNFETTEHIIIKSLTKTYITTNIGKIDDVFDEVFIDNGGCVEFHYLEKNWYILSSDGFKT